MFALDPAALDDAAVRLTAAAGALACLDVSGPLGAAGDELAGSATATGCLWLATGLDAALDAWAAGVVGLSGAARQVSLDAVTTDHDVASRHSGLGLP